MIPEDITSRSFLVSLRGYDRDEVHAFLAQVADEMAGLQERIDELEELATAPAPTGAVAAESTPHAEAAKASAPVAAPAPENPSEMFAQIGRETQRILEAAQAAGEDLRKRAADDAERQVKEARANALRIIAEGERRREAVDRNVAELAEARDSLAADLRELGRSVERSLRELVAEPEPTRTVREGVTASLREAAPSAGPDPDPETDVESAAAAAHPVDAEVDPDAADGQPEAADEQPEAADEQPEAADDAAGSEPMLALVPDAGDGADEADDVPAAEVDETAVLVDPASRDVDSVILEQAHALRAQALGPLHPKLVRKLKRGLQDVQNGMLDRLRRADGKGEPASFLPPPDAVEGLTQLAEEFLFSAWWGGCASGELLGDDEIDVPGPEGGFADALISTLMDQLTADLDAALRLGFGAGDDVTALSDRVGVAFAALREEPVEEQSALALLYIYEEGLRAAWQVGEATHRVWARATEPPCTDPRCAQNHEVGPVPLDDPFPSGHLYPPVRVGCNCTTVPAIPESEPAS